MECYCDAEMPTVYRETAIKAVRKEHRCCECRCTIRPGEPCLQVFGVWDGEAMSHRLCERCLAAKQYVEAHLPCFCWLWDSRGAMLDDMRQSVAYYQHECPGMGMEFGRLMVAIKRRASADRRACLAGVA